MRIKEFTYSLNIEGEFPRICVNHPFQAPKSLSKYYSINEQNILAFLDRKFFASQPEYFNDLFDGQHFNLNIEECDFETFKFLLENKNIQQEKNKYSQNSKEWLHKMRNTLYSILNAKIGIICLTEQRVSELMWAHYTDNQGFLVEYNCASFPANFGNPIPINYIQYSTEFKLPNGDLALKFYINYLIKKDIWDYENEFRFIAHSPNYPSFETVGRFSNQKHDYKKESRLIQYSQSAIIKVVLGFNFFTQFISEVTEEYAIVDFDRPTGILRKALIDDIILNNIKTYIIHIGVATKDLIENEISIELIQGTSYKIITQTNTL